MHLRADEPAPEGTTWSEEFLRSEVADALRNREMPLEALRYDITPDGLHYFLAHFDIPFLSSDDWLLSIGGLVERPLSLTLEELRRRPSVTKPVTLECAGNGRALMSPRPYGQPWMVGGVSTAEWTGTPLAPILEEAGLQPSAVDVVFTAADEGTEDGIPQPYERSLPLGEALLPEMVLAYEMNGRPLPPQHGAPVRLIAPGWYGMAHVKWLTGITVIDHAFTGPQQDSYRILQTESDPGAPVTRIGPRALMRPPGVATDEGHRLLRGLHAELDGRAWSGYGAIERVDVSLDGGATWSRAGLGPQPSSHAWVAWTLPASFAAAGSYTLAARAADAEGNEQPMEQVWNLWGYVNNGPQRIDAVVAAE